MIKKTLFLSLLAYCSPIFSESAFIPKYSPADKPTATLLKNQRNYVKSKTAPDFWALTPYYSGMHVDHTASATSVAMIINALKQNTKYSSSDEYVSGESILKKVKAENWAKKLSGKKPAGVNLEELTKISQASLAAYGLTNAKAESFAINDASSENIKKVRELLIKNEETDNNFLVAHYMQSSFTGDPEGAVGTYSPVAAFDAANDSVLIFETDRKFYEPYWVSLKTFVEGLGNLKNAKTQKPEGGLISLSVQ